MSGTGRKESYLKKEAKQRTGSYILRKADLSAIVAHYKKKYDVDIVVNGTTDIGLAMMVENQQQSQQQEFPEMNSEQIFKEMESLQKNIKKDELLGYLHTIYVNRAWHIGAFLVTPEVIIQLIPYNNVLYHHPKLIAPQAMSAEVFNEGEDKNPSLPSPLLLSGFTFFLGVADIVAAHPQSKDDNVCGTMNILYLKELLKDHAELFKNGSLLLASEDPSLIGKFIPAPQVLRYSQSEFFNQIYHAFMQDTDQVIITHARTGKKYTVDTLQKWLSENLAQAQLAGNEEHIAYYRDGLEKLAKLRPTWLAAYDAMKSKREQFGISYGEGDDADILNRYISYKSRRFEQLASAEDKKEEDPTKGIKQK